MLLLFWFITLCLFLLALGFVLPWVRAGRLGFLIAGVLCVVSYGLYLHWGSSSYLKQYYSKAEKDIRLKQAEFRILLTEFKKTEFRLRARLEENPNDQDAQQHLLEVLKIKAMLMGPSP